ncbi:unnamed protein product [Lampetra planeri]
MSAKTAAAASSNSAKRACASWRPVSEASGASAITAKCCIGGNSSSSTPEVGVPACMGGGCGTGLVAIDGELERRRSSTRPAAGGKRVAGCCFTAPAFPPFAPCRRFPPLQRVGVPALPTAAFPPFSPRQCFRVMRRSRLLRLVCCAGLAARRCSPVITGLPPHIEVRRAGEGIGGESERGP